MSTAREPTVRQRRPTPRQRRLAAELRRLRELNGLTGDEVAERCAWSTAKVSRIENARSGPRISDIRLLLELYGVNGPRRDELLALAEGAAERGWWEEFPGIHPDYAGFIALENDASTIRQWESLVVPGLFQTEAYARHVVEGWNTVATIAPREIDRRLDVRLRRQRILERTESCELSVILDESVLHRRIGNPTVMREQIRHLSSLSELPHVSVRILPLNGHHTIVAGSFILFEFPPVHDVIFPDTVYTESLTISYLEDEAVTHMYRLAHDELAERALGQLESAHRIAAAQDIW